MVMEKVAMQLVIEKLAVIGGHGPLKSREWRIRSKLGWHNKAKSAVRHLLRGEQMPSLDEAKEIEAAHFKMCAEKWAQNNDENKRLCQTMRDALAAMEATDSEFYAPHIEAVRSILFSRGNMGGNQGGEG